MAFGLLAPLLLGAGAMGQRVVLDQSARNSSEAIKGFMGQAPGVFEADLFPGEAPIPGLKTAGSGLMGDPSNPQRQMEFAANLMSLSPRDRQAALPLFGQLMQTYSQGALQREGWTRSEGMQRERAAEADRHFNITQTGINDRFQQEYQLSRERFDENVRQFGLTQAQEKLKYDDQRTLAWAANARAEAAAARDKAKEERLANDPFAGIKVPSGYQPAVVTGADGRPAAGVVPMRNTQPWVDAQKEVGTLGQARVLLAELYQDMEKTGPEMWGAKSKEMKSKYSQIVAAVAALQNKGVLQQGEMEQIMEGLPDPSAMGTFKGSAQAAYSKTDEIFKGTLNQRRRAYDGWGLDIQGDTALDAIRAQRSSGFVPKLPAGSKPVGG